MRRQEGPQPSAQRRPILRSHHRQHRSEILRPPPRYIVQHLPPLCGDTQSHLPPIPRVRGPLQETGRLQAVAQPAGRRERDGQPFRQCRQIHPRRGLHDVQRPELVHRQPEGHLMSRQRPQGRQNVHGIGDLQRSSPRAVTRSTPPVVTGTAETDHAHITLSNIRAIRVLPRQRAYPIATDASSLIPAHPWALSAFGAAREPLAPRKPGRPRPDDTRPRPNRPSSGAAAQCLQPGKPAQHWRGPTVHTLAHEGLP